MHISAINNFSYKNYNCSGPCPEPKCTSFKGNEENDHFGTYKENVPSLRTRNLWNAMKLVAVMMVPVGLIQGCELEANAYADSETNVNINTGCCDTCDVDTVHVDNGAYYRSPVMDSLNEIFHRLGMDTTGGHVITMMRGTRELGDDNFVLQRSIDTFNVKESSQNRVVYDRKNYGFNPETGDYDVSMGNQKVAYTLTESGKLKGQIFAPVPGNNDDEYERVAVRLFRSGNGGRVYEYLPGSNTPIGYFYPGDPNTIYWTNEEGTSARVAHFDMRKEDVLLPKEKGIVE